MKGGQEYGGGSYVSCFFQVPHGSWGQVPRFWPLEEARAALEGPLHPTANGGSAALGRHRLTHLPVAQQDYPHQDDIDVGPQGLVMIDFVDLKDNNGGRGSVSRNYRPKDHLPLMREGPGEALPTHPRCAMPSIKQP